MSLMDTPLETLLLATVAILVAAFARHAWQIQRESPAWPSVQGEIVTSRVVAQNETGDAHGTSGHHWRAELSYRYQVQGVTHTGTRIRAMGRNHFDEASAQAELAPFPVGAKVPVYYRPEAPGTSVLIPG
jgi:Protein of unknown function (DUF3592)